MAHTRLIHTRPIRLGRSRLGRSMVGRSATGGSAFKPNIEGPLMGGTCRLIGRGEFSATSRTVFCTTADRCGSCAMTRLDAATGEAGAVGCRPPSFEQGAAHTAKAEGIGIILTAFRADHDGSPEIFFVNSVVYFLVYSVVDSNSSRQCHSVYPFILKCERFCHVQSI